MQSKLTSVLFLEVFHDKHNTVLPVQKTQSIKLPNHDLDPKMVNSAFLVVITLDKQFAC